MPSSNHCLPSLTRRQLIALMASFGVSAEALAQDATQVNRRSYRVVFENDRVRVVEYLSRPGLGICGQGRHSHPDHLTVLLTDAKAKVTLPNGKTILAENKVGDVFWDPAATHTVENVGGSGTRAYIVEMKDKNWQPSTG